MLKCNKCLKEKSKSEFKKCSRISRGYIYSCKSCEKERKAILKKQKAEEVYFYLAEHSCKYCGETNPLKLEFDHINKKDKQYNISDMLSKEYSMKSIFNEIAKCRVLCSNCHREKTHREQNTLTYQIHLECNI
jgi:5-methylcytosine-specific restriction endonuclease McrA